MQTFALDFFRNIGYTSPLQFDRSLTLAEASDELNIAPTDLMQRALGDDEARIHLLFQFTADQLTQQNGLFGAQPDHDLYDAFVFLALDLRDGNYSRSDVAALARGFNRPFASPVIVLMRHGQTLSLASVARRESKTAAGEHVLQKVSMLKDIRIDNPHRVHSQILEELAGAKVNSHNWDEFLKNWNAVLDISELNRKFYRELSNWYFWAVQNVEFPRPQSDKRSLEEHHAMSVIRLITRLIFVWFIKERDLVPDELFQKPEVEKLLGPLEPVHSL